MVIEAIFVRIKQLKIGILYKAFGNALLQDFVCRREKKSTD